MDEKFGCAMDEDLLAEMVRIQDDVRVAFGWDYRDDLNSARAMALAFQADSPYGVPHWTSQGREDTLSGIKEKISNAKQIVLVGAAAQKSELDLEWPEGTQFIAADGAIGALPNRIKPTCIVTDLDGGEHLDKAALNGAPMIVHAHGDNQLRWEQYFPDWANGGQPPLVLTHQTREVFSNMYNPGGFTDGDRAACLLHWINVDLSIVKLIGYSTDHLGSWSGTTKPALKIKKLSWMKRILEQLHPRFGDHIS